MRHAGMRLVTHQQRDLGQLGLVLHSTFEAADHGCVDRASLVPSVQHAMRDFLISQRPPFPSPPEYGYALDRCHQCMAIPGLTTDDCRPGRRAAPPQPSTAYDDAYPLLTYRSDREWLLQDQRVHPDTGVAEPQTIAKLAIA